MLVGEQRADGGDPEPVEDADVEAEPRQDEEADGGRVAGLLASREVVAISCGLPGNESAVDAYLMLRSAQALRQLLGIKSQRLARVWRNAHGDRSGSDAYDDDDNHHFDQRKATVDFDQRKAMVAIG